jgi:hypothetical protein
LQFVGDVASHLLLAGGELGSDVVDALPDVSETERYRLNCSFSGDGAAEASATGAANQESCGDEFAIISLAVSP